MYSMCIIYVQIDGSRDVDGTKRGDPTDTSGVRNTENYWICALKTRTGRWTCSTNNHTKRPKRREASYREAVADEVKFGIYIRGKHNDNKTGSTEH